MIELTRLFTTESKYPLPSLSELYTAKLPLQLPEDDRQKLVQTKLFGQTLNTG